MSILTVVGFSGGFGRRDFRRVFTPPTGRTFRHSCNRGKQLLGRTRFHSQTAKAHHGQSKPSRCFRPGIRNINSSLIEIQKWLHDVISSYAISAVAIPTVDNFNLQ